MLSANLEPVGRVRFGKTLLLAMLTGSAAALILIEIARDHIPALAEHFIKLSRGRLGRPEIKLKVKDLERLQDYDRSPSRTASLPRAARMASSSVS